MARLVEDLMSLSRVEINEHVPPRDLVDLRELLASVADTLAIRAEQRQMQIALDLPENLPEVIGDMDQLTQVFHNLVDNAEVWTCRHAHSYCRASRRSHAGRSQHRRFRRSRRRG